MVFLGFNCSRIAYLARMTVLQKLKKTVAEHELLDKGDSVLVALSGGPDSVALLHILSRLRKNKKSMRLRLGAVYVNHQIRKAASKKRIASS